MIHKSVLLQETIDGLNIENGDVVVDATINGGGHTEEICRRYGNAVKVIGLDVDPDAVERGRERLKNHKNVLILNRSFSEIAQALDEVKFEKVSGILYDLGLSSNQLEDSGRGFSFKRNEPLSMKMGKDREGISAKEILNEWGEESLADIIYGYGEERFARRIAKQIVLLREEKPFETTEDLVRAVNLSVPGWYKRKKIHPATKTFQAIRIAVNNELNNLRNSLDSAVLRLVDGGRIAAISFHSLEDRILKRYFAEWEKKGIGKRINKKPIIAGREEQKENPRSRSAKLRIFEKIK